MEFQNIYVCMFKNRDIPNWIPIIPNYIVSSVHLVLQHWLWVIRII